MSATLPLQAERDAMAATLRDLVQGADLVMPYFDGAALSYIREVKRLAQAGLIMPALEEPECDHAWTPVGDEEGNPRLIRGTHDVSYMECQDCGATRAITELDLRAMRDEADYDRCAAQENAR